jgi:hypothetical protein
MKMSVIGRMDRERKIELIVGGGGRYGEDGVRGAPVALLALVDLLGLGTYGLDRVAGLLEAKARVVELHRLVRVFDKHHTQTLRHLFSVSFLLCCVQ